MSDEVNPYASPQSARDPVVLVEEPHDVWRDGPLLVMRKGGVLPDRCVKCNRPANGYRLTRHLIWHHPAWYLLMLCGVIYVFAFFAVLHTARIEIGLCEAHRRRRWIASAIAALLIVGGILAVFLSESNWFLGDASPLSMLGVIIVAAGLLIGILGSLTVLPTKIDRDYVWLKQDHADYLNQLPQFGEAGRRTN